MSFSVYTSCALNYLPKARALAESLRAHQPDARLTLCLNDPVPSWLDLGREPFDQVWLPEDLGFDRAWIFQHNVMELCTAVKGRALKRLISQDPAEFVLYLDPDVYLFDTLDPVRDMMHGASIGLVPHILSPETSDAGVRLTEISVMDHGIYNLGHLVLRPDPTGRAFADWWAARLDKYCFDDRDHGLFTDQRWVDLVPAIFEHVRVLRSPGLDVASWNLSGRHVRHHGEANAPRFTVNGEPLITYHFSGTGPNGAHRRVRETFDPGNPATAEIERIYEQTIADFGQSDFANHQGSFEFFEDGTPVTAEARKLYRRHGDLRRAFPEPFASAPGRASYLGWLREHRPGLVDGLVVPEARRAQAFLDLFDAQFYLVRYPEVAAAIEAGLFRSAADHYCRIGSCLLMDPNEFFVSSHYYEAARDHDPHLFTHGRGAREGTLLWHYLASGLANAMEPIEFFDSRWYINQNPDVEAALRTGRITTPLAHFLHYGSAEGRDPGPGFAGAEYLAGSPDAQRLINAPLDGARGAFGAFVRLGGVAGRTGFEQTPDQSSDEAVGARVTSDDTRQKVPA